MGWATGQNHLRGGRKPPEQCRTQRAYAPRSGLCPKRSAFTLIELLVVMGIVLLLAAIAILVVPAAMDSQRSSQGASMLQGWILNAQQRAVLDRAARGIRLLPDPNNPQYLIKAQYIERPDDFTGGTVNTPMNASNQPILNALQFNGVDLTGGNTDQSEYLVQPGDYVEVLGGGAVHHISTTFSPSVTANSVILDSPLPVPITVPTANYRIIRSARLSGEDPETLPTDIAVDIAPKDSSGNTYATTLPLNADGTLDILFSPKGEVLGNIVSPYLVLWVHDTSQADSFSADPSLIAIFTRSGRVGAYPVNPDSTQTSGNGLSFPYFYVQ
jgi:prepilin-type N-terminal cleavage/methylation domain-containing protein